MEELAILIVQISVLHIAKVYIVLWHCDLHGHCHNQPDDGSNQEQVQAQITSNLTQQALHNILALEPQRWSACSAHLRPIEDAGLVHVIPDVEAGCGALVLGQRELPSPPLPDCRVQHVQVG